MIASSHLIGRAHTLTDVSPDFRHDKQDVKVLRKILPLEGTPEAITSFARHAYKLSDYGYWFMLSTLWVSYTGWSDLDLWKRLFSSSRGSRLTSIMKPSELALFNVLPDILHVYRAHRPRESDWISYTMVPEKAAEFAARRGIDRVKQYRVSKDDVLCLFLRRGEFEVLVLDKEKACFVQDLFVIKTATGEGYGI